MLFGQKLLNSHRKLKRLAKALIRLRMCAAGLSLCWSQLLEISCRCSNDILAIGGSNLQRGVRFVDCTWLFAIFSWFFLKILDENGIVLSQRGIRTNPLNPGALNPLWICHWSFFNPFRLETLNGYFCKQCRSRWNATKCGISSGSALFAKTTTIFWERNSILFGNYM